MPNPIAVMDDGELLNRIKSSYYRASGGMLNTTDVETEHTMQLIKARDEQIQKQAYTAGANSVNSTFEQVALDARIDELERLQMTSIYIENVHDKLDRLVLMRRNSLVELNQKKEVK